MRIASICLALYWLAIFVGTHLPGTSVPHLYLSDKALHFGAYAGLAFLLAWAIPTQTGRLRLHILVVMMIVTTYACIDEVSQKFIPGRHSSFGDLLADLLGATTGIAVYLTFRSLLASTNWGRRIIHALSR